MLLSPQQYFSVDICGWMSANHAVSTIRHKECLTTRFLTFKCEDSEWLDLIRVPYVEV